MKLRERGATEEDWEKALAGKVESIRPRNLKRS